RRNTEDAGCLRTSVGQREIQLGRASSRIQVAELGTAGAGPAEGARGHAQGKAHSRDRVWARALAPRIHQVGSVPRGRRRPGPASRGRSGGETVGRSGTGPRLWQSWRADGAGTRLWSGPEVHPLRFASRPRTE